MIQNNDAMRDYLDEDQLRAVQHRGSNLLIIAGAGSGKTRTLTQRAISFLDEIEPDHLMVVTFTKKAAAEIKDRITTSVPGALHKAIKKSWIGTIHSICWRMLMDHGQLVGLADNWSVLDQGDSRRVIGLSAKTYGVYEKRQIDNIARLFSYARNSLTDWRQWVQTQRFPEVPGPETVGKIVESYTRRCRRSSRVDFDDLQILTLNLLQKFPDVLQEYQAKFKVIMIDEYQDTNRVQAEIFSLLSCPENHITVVGDDAQSIYGFRAATVENILTFQEQFQADKLTLPENYRSTPQVVHLSNASIVHNRNQIHKKVYSKQQPGKLPIYCHLKNPNAEAGFVLSRIKSLLDQGTKLNQIAVLFRATRLAAALELFLKQESIPYIVVGGEDFFTLEHIKLILNMARLLVNPEDSISLGALQELLGFSSPEMVDGIENQADQGQLSFWTLAIEKVELVNPADQQDLQSLLAFQDVIAQFQTRMVEGVSITPIITNIIEYLSPALKKKFPANWQEILDDFATLQTVASQFTSLPDFLNSLALDQFISEDEHGQQLLTLSTIHGAKGLEWDHVFIIGIVEFWFPLNLAIQQTGTDEEERRLFYVATTRAKRSLTLTSYAESLNPYGRMMSQRVSRFIHELPEAVYKTARR